MLLGKQIRLRRLLNRKSNKILAVTLDHPIARGVLPGIVDVSETLRAVMAGGPDAVTLHKGIAATCMPPYADDTALIIKCSSFSPYQYTYDTLVTEVDEAVRLGADAVAIGLIVGDTRQSEGLKMVGQFIRQADLASMPVVAHIYPRGDLIPKDEQATVENVQYAVRVGAELGVSFIKTTYTGSAESFRSVVEACPAMVIAAGGISAPDVRSYLQKTRDVMDSGAAGVAYGRFLWQYADPARLIQAIKGVIHDNLSVEVVMEQYDLQ
jgi:DhnA family fructose-bisphosphate aldolase class Ia